MVEPRRADDDDGVEASEQAGGDRPKADAMGTHRRDR
jgi:hypothetical protein